MNDLHSLSRNGTKEFSRRVRKNLNFIISRRSDGEDVHEVTQLVISLLGIIVFPWEAGALNRLEKLSLSKLESEGWPHWDILLDEKADTKNLHRLIRHLRNAASHRRLRFLSDDPEMDKVEIEFEDAANNNAPPNWRAKIKAADLKVFCDLFTKQIEELVS